MRLTLQFFSCIFRHFKNALTGEHGRTRLREILHIKGIYVYFDRKKNPASEIQRFASKLHLKLKIFSRPAGFFTKMLRFDENFQRNFQRNLLVTLKIALDQKT
jgi:hypothetical protein